MAVATVSSIVWHAIGWPCQAGQGRRVPARPAMLRRLGPTGAAAAHAQASFSSQSSFHWSSQSSMLSPTVWKSRPTGSKLPGSGSMPP